MIDPVPISVVDIGSEEEAMVVEVLRSGRLAQGPMVEQLEREFASIHGVDHAVAVNNGTTALVAAIQAFELRPGDEVITTPFSFVATLNAILEAGATARFADVTDDFCIDPGSVQKLIGPRTRAILPVHLYGLPADMLRLSAMARDAGVALIEDAAQAHGARVANQPVGSFGVGCFSLYATKNIMCGEGGLITTNDEAIADRLRLLRNQGMRARYQYEIAGHNYRMTELQAAIAIPQLGRLSAITSARQKNAAILSAQLDQVPGLVTPVIPDSRSHVFHQYTVRITSNAPVSRDEFGAFLADSGVTTGVYYPKLMHDYPCFHDHPLIVADDTPHARSFADEVISLPVHQKLTASDLERIVDATQSALRT
jgi:perosamine synthetase